MRQTNRRCRGRGVASKMADVDAYQEDEEDLEEDFTNLVDMQKQVEEWVCHSGADEEQQKVAKDWKEAAETLLWKVEKLEADTGTKQDRAIARLKLHWCLSTIHSNVEELHDQGYDTAVSQDKHKPGAVKNLQDILLGVVDIGQDYDDEVLQLDAVEALALLHSTTCYFEDLSKALATSFALYPTKDKALAFLRSIEEQDVNNIFVRVSNWANIAGDLVEFDSPWCHRWYPEYVHIYFWLVENAGARREELVKRDLSHCLQRGANAPPQRFYRALQLGEQHPPNPTFVSFNQRIIKSYGADQTRSGFTFSDDRQLLSSFRGDGEQTARREGTVGS